MTLTRDDIIAEARSWIGTPYQHQACAKGAGCDCLGLIRGLYRYTHGSEPPMPAAYAPEWAELRKDDQLLHAAQRYLHEIEGQAQTPMPAEIILFRWAPQYPCKHLGVMSGSDRFIHAYEPVGVVESPLVPMWRNRIAARFSFFPN